MLSEPRRTVQMQAIADVEREILRWAPGCPEVQRTRGPKLQNYRKGPGVVHSLNLAAAGSDRLPRWGHLCPREPWATIPAPRPSSFGLACMQSSGCMPLLWALGPVLSRTPHQPPTWFVFGFSICKIRVWGSVSSKGSLISINLSSNKTQLMAHWHTSMKIALSQS